MNNKMQNIKLLYLLATDNTDKIVSFSNGWGSLSIVVYLLQEIEFIL